MRTILIGYCLLLLNFSCDDQDLEPFTLIEIESGKRFGFCMGYCSTVVTQNASQTVYHKTSTQGSNLPEIICTTATEGESWHRLVNAVDASFFALDSVIGCPDCVDQGSEFIQVVTSERSHIIRFDPGMGEQIHPLVTHLRDIRAEVTVDSTCMK
jgi:hypothetical protein